MTIGDFPEGSRRAIIGSSTTTTTTTTTTTNKQQIIIIITISREIGRKSQLPVSELRARACHLRRSSGNLLCYYHYDFVHYYYHYCNYHY